MQKPTNGGDAEANWSKSLAKTGQGASFAANNSASQTPRWHRATAGAGEPVTVAMSPAGNGVWEVVLLPAEGNLELAVIASDGTNVVETEVTTLEVVAGATPAAPASSGSLLAAAALGAVAMLGALALRRRPD